MKLRRMLFVLLALLAACASGSPRQDDPQPKLQTDWTPFGDTLNAYQAERQRPLDVKHYAIVLKVDLDQQTVEGKTDITFAPIRAADTVEFDAGLMKIENVSLEGKPLRFSHKNEKLSIELSRKLSAGEKAVVSIRYSTGRSRGLTFVAPDESYPDRPRMVWSDGEPEQNHHWFPCYDYPNTRSTSEVTVIAPAKYTAVSNGRLVDRTEKDGWATTRWSQETDHASYLISVIVYEMDTFVDHVGSLPVEYRIPKGKWSEADVRRCMGMTPEIIKYFQEKIGTPYPWAKYAQTLVWDFTWGGMENTSATTMYQWVVYPERIAPHKYEEAIIAHELSHQWFGDLVTCRNWANIWLNEGFATYFEWLWTEHRYGRDRMRFEMYGTLSDAGMAGIFAEEDKYRRPTLCNVYTAPRDMFDSHTYDRGGWILHMLRDVLGDEKWWKGIAHYVKKHAHQVVDTNDFRKAMEEATGEDLVWFFDQWVRKIGYPVFEVSHRHENGKVVLTVEQKQEATRVQCGPLVSEVPAVFRVPVDIEVDGQVRRVWIEKRRQEIVFDSATPPKLISFDRTGSVLKKLTWKKSNEELIYQLRHDPEVMGRMWAANQLGAIKDAPESVSTALGEARADTDFQVRFAAATALGKLNTDAAADALAQMLEPEKDARVRRRILKTLGEYSMREDVKKVLREAMKTEKEPWSRTAAALSLGRSGSGAFDELMIFLQENQKDEYIAPGAIEALSATGEARGLPVFLDYLKYGQFPSARNQALQALTARLEKASDEKVYDRVVAMVDDPDREIRPIAIDWLGEHGEAKALARLEERLPKEFEEGIEKSLKESIAKIRKRLAPK